MKIDEIVARWNAEEEAIRARLAAPGVATARDVAGRSGMQVFEGIFAGELPPAPIGDTLDFVPVHMAPGEAVFQGRPKRRHYNPLGTVHGGWPQPCWTQPSAARSTPPCPLARASPHSSSR